MREPAADVPAGIDLRAVRADLAAVVGAELDGDLLLDRLSSGLSSAGVFRVGYRSAGGGRGTLVLKIPDLAARTGTRSGVENVDPGALDRELLLLRAGFASEVEAAKSTAAGGWTDVVHLPRVLALNGGPDGVRIWMADHGESFASAWTPDRAIAVGGLAAAVHRLGGLPSVRAAGPDLSRREYAAYAHHLPLCRSNLKRLTAAGHGGPLTAEEIDRAARLLDHTPWALAELDRRPLHFCHGDLNPRNVGGTQPDWLVTDWASAGLAPAGSDLAVFLSTYEVFGGDRGDLSRGALAEELIRRYTAALAAGGTLLPAAEVRDVVLLWWLTWGLHLRLGPGLRALLDPGVGPEEAAGIAADVRAGLADCAAGLALAGTGEPWS